MVLTTLLGSAFGLVLTWAQVSEDKVGAGLAKGYVFTLRCTPPIVLLFWSFMDYPNFELVVGHWYWPLVQVCLCACCHVSSLCRYDLWGSSRQPIWPFPKARWKRAWVSDWHQLKPFGGLSFPKPFVWLFQIWRLPSWTSCAMPLWLIPLALSILWGAGNNLISRNLGNYSLETYTAVAVIYWGIALVISFSAQLIEKRLSVTER